MLKKRHISVCIIVLLLQSSSSVVATGDLLVVTETSDDTHTQIETIYELDTPSSPTDTTDSQVDTTTPVRATTNHPDDASQDNPNSTLQSPSPVRAVINRPHEATPSEDTSTFQDSTDTVRTENIPPTDTDDTTLISDEHQDTDYEDPEDSSTAPQDDLSQDTTDPVRAVINRPIEVTDSEDISTPQDYTDTDDTSTQDLIDTITQEHQSLCTRSAVECQALVDEATGQAEVTLIENEEDERIDPDSGTLYDDTHSSESEEGVHVVELQDTLSHEEQNTDPTAVGTGTSSGSGSGDTSPIDSYEDSSELDLKSDSYNTNTSFTVSETLTLTSQPALAARSSTHTDSTLGSQTHTARIDPGTTVTSATDQAITLNTLQIEALTTPPEGFGDTLIGMIELGPTDDHLLFSHPVQITFPVDSDYEGKTVSVFVHHYGDEEYSTDGITTDPNATCLPDGLSSHPSYQVTVIGESVTFYTCGASTFVLDPDGDTTDEATLWLKADAGTNCTTDGCDISGWDEQSGNTAFVGNQPVQNNAIRRPTYGANALNFNPVINFDTSGGARQRVQTNNVSTTDLLGTNRDEGSYYMVAVPADQNIMQHGGRIRVRNNQARLGQNTYINYGQTLSATNAEVMTFNRNGSAYNAYINGIQTGVGTNAGIGTAQNTRLRVGRVGATYFSGALAEVMIYNESHGTTERETLQSYLAIKYGITLDSSVGDYASSSDTSIYQIDATYQNDIAGIGRDDATTLDQRISSSVNAGSQLTIATDDDFTSANSGSRTQLSDQQFLIRGHDGSDGTTTQTSDLDTGIYDSRISKEWKIENTGTVGAVAVQINNLPALGVDQYYALLGDSDGTFSVGATPLITGSTNGTFTGITFPAGVSYFTVALETITIPFAPTALSVSGSSVAEEQTPSVLIGSFITTDPNSTDTHTYTLTGGVGDTDNSSFTISGDQLFINVIADFETQPSYSIRVRTTDQGGLFYEEVLTITVIDGADATCGDGNIENAETCDDSNTTPGDGCDATCQIESGRYCPDSLLCGNGTIDQGEECDDSNTDGGDGCSSICLNETIVDFASFTGEALDPESGDDFGVSGPADWSLSNSGYTISVLATTNPYPSVLYSDEALWSTTMPKAVEVGFTNAGDDDFIGFVVGWEPGDFSNPSADYLFISWKDTDQFFDFNDTITPVAGGTAQAGLAVSRIQGVVGWDELWQLTDYAATTGTITELSRGTVYGNQGYAGNVSGFTFFYATGQLDVYVDGVVDISLTGSFTDGRFGLYVFAQQGNSFSFGQTPPYSAGGVCYGICGDSMQVGAETCDDGNTTNGDGCNEYCLIEEVNECLGEGGGNNCNINATCTDTYESFTCTCNAGYTGDGVSCTDGSNSIPSDITLSGSTTIVENLLTGTSLGTLTTTDGDVTDTHTYSFGCTTGGADDSFFTFGGVSGDILQTNSLFDFEDPQDANTDNVYEICIRTTDSQGGTYDENFSITISDVDEQLCLTNQASYNRPSVTIDTVDQIATATLTGGFGIQDSIHTASGRYTTLQLVSLSGSSTTNTIPLTNFMIQEPDAPTYVSGDVTGLIDIGTSFASYTTIATPLTYLKRDTTASNPLLNTEYTTSPTVQITIPAYQPVDTYSARIEYTLYEL